MILFCDLPKVNVPFSDGLKVIHQKTPRELDFPEILLPLLLLKLCSLTGVWEAFFHFRAFVVANSAYRKCIQPVFPSAALLIFSRKH